MTSYLTILPDELYMQVYRYYHFKQWLDMLLCLDPLFEIVIK